MNELTEPQRNQSKNLRSNPASKENLSNVKLHGITYPAQNLPSCKTDAELCNQHGIKKQVEVRLVNVITAGSNSKLKLERKIDHKCLKIFACPKPNCSFKGRLPWILKAHMKKHVEARNHICKLCNRTYKYKGDLQAHLKAIHNLQIQKGEHSEEIVCYSPGCRFRFRSPTSYKEHQKLHPKNLQYKCKFCKEAFEKTFELVKHERSSHRNIRFACPLCSFRTNAHFRLRHHISIHTGEKPYKCHLCEYSASQKTYLTKHLKCHSQEKEYKCNLCYKRFTLRGRLRSHLRTHTGEKPYQCGICNRNFRESGSLAFHIRTHTGEKPYACTLCPYSASQSGGLKVHMKRNHSFPIERTRDFKCTQCSKTFFDKYVLSLHIRIHTGEKPYSCQFCELKFKQTQALKQHSLLCRVRQKLYLSSPFKCSITTCHYASNLKANLKRHIQRMHKKETRS